MVAEEDVAALTDGAHYVIQLLVALARKVLHPVVGAVERRTDKVGHPSVEDDELLGGTLLDVEAACDEAAALGHYGTSELEVELLSRTQTKMGGIGGEVGFERRHGVAVGVVVVDAQSAAHVDALHGPDALGLQLFLQFIDAMGQGHEVVHDKQLAADMEVQAGEADAGHLCGQTDDALHVLHGDAELVLGASRGDVVMGVGSHFGIDAQAHVGSPATLDGQLVDDLQLGQALHVEVLDAGLEPELYLPVSFAHAGEDYLPGREAGVECCLYLTAAHAVGSQPCLPYVAQHLGMGACLDGIVHVVALVALHLGVDGAERLVEQRRVIVIEWSRPLAEAVGGEVSSGHGGVCGIIGLGIRDYWIRD